jgi:peptidoglycan/xylan/chitin deacetylase (PgdA/CDA1 family)
MRERIRVIVAACFYYSGLVKLANRWMRRRSRRCLIILKYHRATGGDLRRQLLYLRRHYRILPLETALKELYTPSEKGKRVPGRRIALALTFDDGYRDNYTYAFALARQLRIPITIFIVPGYIESGACFWWLETDRLMRHAQVEQVTIEGYTYHLGQSEERKALSQAIDTRLTHSRSVARREAFLVDMRKKLAVPADILVDEATLPMTWGEVLKMEESGLVSFGAHTMSHPVLACLDDSEELRWEVAVCRLVLERRLGHPIRTFAYPIGNPENIGEEGLRAVKAAGYEWALTTIQEVNTPQADPHFLKRLNGNVDTHWLVMASELVGLLPIVSRLPRSHSFLKGVVKRLMFQRGTDMFEKGEEGTFALTAFPSGFSAAQSDEGTKR